MPSGVSEYFLRDYDGNTLSWMRPPSTPSAFETDCVFFGNGDSAIEIAIASMAQPGQPKADDLRTLFKKRQAGRPAPVILVVFYDAPDGNALAAVVGTTGDPAPIAGLQPDRLERVCASVLAEPDRHSAVRTFDRLVGSLKDQQSPGLNNSGLFASHELRTGVPARADWASAGCHHRREQERRSPCRQGTSRVPHPKLGDQRSGEKDRSVGDLPTPPA